MAKKTKKASSARYSPSKKPVKKLPKLTREQIGLASRYLATSNLCTLERYKKDIKDLQSLKRALNGAENDAITGAMEGLQLEGGGSIDRYESRACNGYQEEVNSFKADLERGDKSAAYWIERLQEEIPFLFDVPDDHDLSPAGHWQ